MARTPNRMIPLTNAHAMTPEQFVFWAQGFVEGRGNEQIENDPAMVLEALIEVLQNVYLPQPVRTGCGCGGKG